MKNLNRMNVKQLREYARHLLAMIHNLQQQLKQKP